MKRACIGMAVLCLFLAACGDNAPETPAQKLAGTWSIDIDATLEETFKAQAQDLGALPPELKEVAKKGLEQAVGAMTLTFDPEKKTVTGNLPGQAQESSTYTVVKEDGSSVTLEVDGMPLSLEFLSDTTLNINSPAGIVVMKKQ